MKLANVILVLLGLVLAASPCTCVVYVDCDAPGAVHNGASWSTAYKTLGAAIAAHPSGAEIWVKTGVYQERLSLNGLFTLYGGFLGYETSVSQRIIGVFPTTIDAQRQGSAITLATGNGTNTSTVDGFSIINGKAYDGGGVWVAANAVMNLHNCRIEHCTATRYGGGVYYSSYCFIGTAWGEMVNCYVANNTALDGGGVVVEYHSYTTLQNCIIFRNHATGSGGGGYFRFHSGPHVLNCTIAYNRADVNGGGAYCYYGGPQDFQHCIFAFNNAPIGGGLFGDGPVGYDVSTTYTYCDLYSNAGGDYANLMPPPSNFIGNFSADPLFLFPSFDDYHLSVGSPCSGVGAFPLESVYRLGRIGLAKKLPDGSSVNFTGKVVSGADGSNTYMQELDRSTSLIVQGLTGCSYGNILDSLSGMISTDTNGTKVLTSASATIHSGFSYSMKPIAVTSRHLQSALGYRAHIYGRVTATVPGGFLIYDGTTDLSVRYNGSVQIGSMVTANGVYTVAGDFVATSVSPL